MLSSIKDLGVVIPVHNNWRYTEELLNSFVNHDFQKVDLITVLIVDNYSDEQDRNNLIKYVETNTNTNSKILFVVELNETNIGFAKACNQGIKKLGGNGRCDVLLMNNDMLLKDGCIDALITAAYKSDDIGIVGGLLLHPDNKIQHGGGVLGTFGWGVHNYAGQQYREGFLTDDIEVEYVTGALFYIKRSTLNLLEGFDEQFSPAYFEEVDYCYRARQIGLKTVFTPKAIAVHYENVTGKAMMNSTEQLKRTFSDTNQIKFYKKWDKLRLQQGGKYLFSKDCYDPKNKLLLVSRIHGMWSFVGVMKNLVKGLKRNGMDVAIAPEEYHEVGPITDWEIKEMVEKPHDYWNRTVLRSCEGDHMYLMPPAGGKRIAHTTGESSFMNSRWSEQLGAVDEIWTTSRFFKNVIESNLIREVPVKVIPNSVDVQKYNNIVAGKGIQGLRGINFVSIFHFGDRKGPDILLKAFAKAFNKNDDVTLTIHSLSMEYVLRQTNSSVYNYIQEVTQTEDRPPILVTSKYIIDEFMPSFIRNFDVMVLSTRAEGFGLPVLEAAACGLPAIVTGYSGVLDVVDETTGWLIDYSLVDIPLQYLSYYKNYIGGKWAEPNVDHLVDLFRSVANDRGKIRDKGKRAFDKAQQFSIDAVGALAKKEIQK